MKKILVTGATGFVGQHLCEKLLASHYSVRGLSRRGDPGPLPNLPSRAKIEWFKGDLTEAPTLLLACQGVDAVIHAGAMRPLRGTGGFEAHNVQGTKNLADALKHAITQPSGPALLIFISSLAAGGPTPERKPLRQETDSDSPISTYGRSKLECERILERELSTLPWISLRPPSVYGPGDDAMFSFYKLISRGIMPVMVPRTPGLKSKSLSLIYVHDLTHQILQVLKTMDGGRSTPSADSTLLAKPENFRNGTLARNVFYVTSQDSIPVPELTRTIARAIGKRPHAIQITPFIVDALLQIARIRKAFGFTRGWNSEKLLDLIPDRWCCSAARFKETFGDPHPTPLEQGIQTTATWYVKSGWLKSPFNSL